MCRDKEDKQKKQAYFNHKARQTANLNAMDQTEQALCARSQVEQNAAEALCELSGHVAGNALEPLQIKGLVAALLVSTLPCLSFAVSNHSTERSSGQCFGFAQ